MKKVEGSAYVKLLECTNPIKDKWRIRWNIEVNDDNSATYMEEEFSHKPSENEIKEFIESWYNARTDERIISGFTYEGYQVWLSCENQFNYKSAYDLALQTNGQNLPITFKFGNNDEPFYKKFSTIEELQSFYIQMINHIQNALTDGWKSKDSINISDYSISKATI